MMRRLAGSARLAGMTLGQRRFAFRALDAIRREQERRIRRAVRHAHETVPHYRDTLGRLGIALDDVRSAGDLARLPIVERHELQQEPDRFLSSRHPRGRCLRVRSGGSSGQPREVCIDPAAVMQNAAHAERERQVYHELLGRRSGIVEIRIGSRLGTSTEVRQYLRRHAFIPRPVERAAGAFGLSDPPEEVARAMNEIRPDVVASYGSYLERLGRVLEENPSRFHRPRLFVYGGDPIMPEVRRRLRERLGIEVWTTYQAIESFKIGFECPEHSGLHIHLDLCPVRVVDAEGRDLPPGEVGDVVLSNLVNGATVLLNYRLGDRAFLQEGPCACGRNLPRLSYPVGRVEDWLALPGGREVNTQSLRTIFTNEHQVWQYQVVQEEPTRLRVRVVAEHCVDRPGLVERLRSGFARSVGPDVQIEVDFVPDLERTEAGKVRTFLCRDSRAQALVPTA